MSEQRVALVTGANKGIGLEIAQQLAEQGITVVLGARTLGKAREAAEKLRAKGLNVHPVQLDVTSAEDIAALPAFFKEKFGRLDILVNNAGVSYDFEGEVTGNTLRRTYEANVIGPFEITRVLLPLLKASPGGENRQPIQRPWLTGNDLAGRGRRLFDSRLLLLQGRAQHAYGCGGGATEGDEGQGERSASRMGANRHGWEGCPSIHIGGRKDRRYAGNAAG
ncbi:MAG TPA: SDR family NAD(P)-dependent oxidoreductase [Acidisarcina sp.]|nr:SDR family NAD(P)-dependent oxidoreductase [Acidisarcina sp.]